MTFRTWHSSDSGAPQAMEWRDAAWIASQDPLHRTGVRNVDTFKKICQAHAEGWF